MARWLCGDEFELIDAHGLGHWWSYSFVRSWSSSAIPVHHKTLRYRLDKIEELTGLDLTRHSERLRASIAGILGEQNADHAEILEERGTVSTTRGGGADCGLGLAERHRQLDRIVASEADAPPHRVPDRATRTTRRRRPGAAVHARFARAPSREQVASDVCRCLSSDAGQPVPSARRVR